MFSAFACEHSTVALRSCCHWYLLHVSRAADKASETRLNECRGVLSEILVRRCPYRCDARVVESDGCFGGHRNDVDFKRAASGEGERSTPKALGAMAYLGLNVGQKII